MTLGGTDSENAVKAFKTWIDGIKNHAPVIVLCHAPIQAADVANHGAAVIIWNRKRNRNIERGKESSEEKR